MTDFSVHSLSVNASPYPSSLLVTALLVSFKVTSGIVISEDLYSNKERIHIDPNIARQTEDSFDRYLVMTPINPTDNLTTLSIVKLA